MYPILLCSIIAVMIIIERFIFIAKVKKEGSNIFTGILKSIENGNVSEAIKICNDNSNSISAGIIKAGIIHADRARDEIRELIDEAGTRELSRIEKFLPTLGTIIAVAPMLGLLGTVVGMIQSSDVLARLGTSNPAELLIGISSALITTAFGLIIAIPCLIFYNYLIQKSQRTIMEISKNADDVVELLTKDRNIKKH
jgi:biopolymer transport protein ExbB